MRNALVGKLFEEAEEFLRAIDRDAKVEELADLLEIIRALASNQGTSFGDVIGRADEKRARRGGFEGGVVLVETAIHSPSQLGGQGQQLIARRLQDLIRTRRKDGGFIVPLLALIDVVQAAGVTIPVGPNASSIKLRIRSGALDIEEIETKNSLVHQLTLPVDTQLKDTSRRKKTKSGNGGF